MKHMVKIAIASLTLCGCVTIVANGQESNRTRQIGSFDRVEVSNGIEVTLACGDSARAVVEGSDEDVRDTVVRVEGRVLHVERGSFFGSHNRRVRVEVTAPNPADGLSASSGAALRAPACAISTAHLDLSASSGAVIKLAGATGRLIAEASSGATIAPMPAGRIDAREAKVSASSGADVRLCSVGSLDGRAGTGASVVADIGRLGDFSTGMGGSMASKSCP